MKSRIGLDDSPEYRTQPSVLLNHKLKPDSLGLRSAELNHGCIRSRITGLLHLMTEIKEGLHWLNSNPTILSFKVLYSRVWDGSESPHRLTGLL